MNIGFIFALLATVSFALSAFPYSFLHNYANTKVVTFWRLLFASILLILIGFIFESSTFSNIFSNNYSAAWLWIGLSGIITFLLGDFFIFESYAVLGPSKGSLLTALSPAMALAFGIALLGENINTIGILGLLITIGGVIIVNSKKTKSSTQFTKQQVTKAIILGVLGASCLGIGIALSKQGAIKMQEQKLELSAIAITFIRIVVPFIIYTLFAIIFLSKEKFTTILTNKKGRSLLLLGMLLNPTTGILFSMYSISYMDVAVAQTIFSTAPLISLAIDIFYFKQKPTIQSIIGSLIAVLGVVLLIFRNTIF